MRKRNMVCTILVFVMIIGIFLGFSITAQAAGSGTIYMCPSSEWIYSSGRYAVHYFTSTGDQWVNMSQVDGQYYSANVTDCETLEFCVMQPYTSENVDENVMYRSVIVEYPSGSLNCYIMNSETEGSWSVAPFASNDTVMYIVPTQSWIDSGYRIVAEFVVSGQSKWSEATLVEGSSEYYKLGSPNDFETVTFHLMSGSVIISSDAVESTEPFYYELIKEGDTATNTFFMDGNFWGYTDEGIFNVGDGGDSEEGVEGEEGEEVGGETTKITNVMFGDSKDNLTNEGDLCDVISSLSETIYIQLTNNVTLEETIVVDGKNIYLDLAGYEINVMTYGFVIKNEGHLTLSDTTDTPEIGGRVYSELGVVYPESEEVYPEEEIVLFDVKYQSNLTFEAGNYCAIGGVVATTNNASSTITVNGGEYETTLGRPIFRLNGGGGKLCINGGSFFTDSNVIEVNTSTSKPRIQITDFDEEVEHISIVQTYEVSDPSTSFILIENDYLTVYNKEKEVIDHAIHGETFYVGWCHKVTYDLNGGSNINLGEYLLPIPGYIEFPSWETMSEPYMMEFSHWECNGQTYETGEQLYVDAIGTTTLKAMWKEQKQYNVTLHSNDGTNKTQTTTEYSMYIPLYEVPSGWTVPEELYLAGWALEPDGTPSFNKFKLTGDTDLYAIYKKREYRITFEALGASPVMWVVTKYHNEDYYFPEPYPVRKGHDFKGWSETLGGEVVYPPDGVYTKNEWDTLYAVWEEHSYTVSYDMNYGAGDIPTQTKMYTQDLTLTEVIPTREGYDFMGWSDTATGDVIYESGDAYTQNSNITLYAVWKLKEYTITYDANGGETALITQTKIHNDDLTLSSQIPTKTGYEFKGWSEALNGEAIYQPGGIYTKNEPVTLYAVWEIVEFNIISYDTETKTATIGIPEAGAYRVVFADYENGRLANIEVAPVTITDAEMKTATITKSFNLGTNDKIMLFDDMTTFDPLCDAYIVK